MPLTQANLRTTFEKLIDAAPKKVSATIPGTTDPVIGVKTTLGRDIQYSTFGLEKGYRFSIVVEYADLTTIPDIDSIIVIDSVSYRLIGSDTDSSDVGIRLDLGQEYA